jgi:hypothetical protein
MLPFKQITQSQFDVKELQPFITEGIKAAIQQLAIQPTEIFEDSEFDSMTSKMKLKLNTQSKANEVLQK